jgi:N-hydroxyarylamine O-acetyltransferase
MTASSSPENKQITEQIVADYFERISYQGSHTPSLQTLIDVHRAHTLAIPFENLNPLLRLPVKLDVSSLKDKIISQGRGGYCFEQNLLFSHVLKLLGFAVKGIAARVMWNVPDGVVPPRGHMLLLIEIDGVSYIADTGFGGLTLPEPIALNPGVSQKTSHESFRIIEDNEYVLQALVKTEWKSLYRFSLVEQLLPDYEVANYYMSTNMNSYFLHNLAAARMDPNKRFTLRNRDFTIHEQTGSTTRQINSIEEMKLLLENVFLIRLPESGHLDETLHTILTR